MLLHTFLEDAAFRAPEATALIEPSRRATYEELNRRANRFANLYRSSGVARGDRVVIALDNSVDMVAAYMGALKAGAVAVPLPGGPKSDRLGAAVLDCTPTLCVIDPAASRALPDDHPVRQVRTTYVADGSLYAALAGCADDKPRVEMAEDDLAAIIYTSGSTGEPRGVMLSHRNFVENARSIVQYLELTAADRVMCVLPFSYVYGLSLLHTHLAVAGSVVIDNRFVFPNVVLAAMHEHAVTGFAGVPSTFALLLHRSALSDVQLPALRYVTQAGGGMPPARVTEWLERGPHVPFFVMYGATEAAARLTYLPPADLPRKLGSIGRAIPTVQVNVITDAGERAKPGEIGELVARGPNISRGYWNRPDETREKFGSLGYRTGDLGYADDEGYLYLVGRLSDMIKAGAHRVGAKEIEDMLNQHAAVLEAAVVGAPDDLLGEVPVAFVSLRTPVADFETALRAFCADRLAPYKVPSRVFVEHELPKLASTGKIDKARLRERAATMPSSRTERTPRQRMELRHG